MSPPHTANNFNLLRLIFAMMVVVYHIVALSGVADWVWLEEPFLSELAEVGVQGFFVLSGFLVYASYERSSLLKLYAEKRVRRLYPAYALVILVCAAGALAVSPEARADIQAVLCYLGANLIFANFLAPDLPGVFEGNRFSEVNGALWTLKIEVMFYLILPLLAWLLRVSGKLAWLLIVLIYAAAEVWRIGLGAAGQFELARQLPGQMSFFIAGMALYQLRLSGWRIHLVGIFGAVLFAASLIFAETEPVRAIGLGCLGVWAATGWPRLLDAARFGDVSYGIYIVHFPIIQTVIALGLFATSGWLGVGVALTTSLLAALLLWHLVEKPALRADSAYRR